MFPDLSQGKERTDEFITPTTLQILDIFHLHDGLSNRGTQMFLKCELKVLSIHNTFSQCIYGIFFSFFGQVRIYCSFLKTAALKGICTC